MVRHNKIDESLQMYVRELLLAYDQAYWKLINQELERCKLERIKLSRDMRRELALQGKWARKKTKYPSLVKEPKIHKMKE